jgi:hypothetical protein
MPNSPRAPAADHPHTTERFVGRPRVHAGDACRAASTRRARRAARVFAGAESAHVVGVYRVRNAARVRTLLDSLPAPGWSAAWWALDEVAEPLRSVTVGSGPGAKFELVNAVLDTSPPGNVWLVVADDDVEFVSGSLVDLLALCAIAGFALAQPAHVAASEVSHEITLSRALSIARRTNFVEIGPLFVVGPTCRDELVPFPAEEEGMGWGLELAWGDLVERGCRLGIVDAIRVRHLDVVGQAYDRRREKDVLQQRLRERGIERWADAQRTLETWPLWRSRPPWSTS